MTTFKMPEPLAKFRSDEFGALFTAAQMQTAYNQGRADQREEQEELELLYENVRIAFSNKRFKN